MTIAIEKANILIAAPTTPPSAETMVGYLARVRFSVLLLHVLLQVPRQQGGQMVRALMKELGHNEKIVHLNLSKKLKACCSLFSFAGVA